MDRIGRAPVLIQVLSDASEMGQSLGILAFTGRHVHNQVGAFLGEGRSFSTQTIFQILRD